MKDNSTILAVDDSGDSLRMLSEILRAEGYTVRPADSGALALASINVSLPELILLDIRMPEMDGFDVCRQLKANERTRGIPVIFLSASIDMAERVEGLRLGAVDFISKPFQRDEMLARVRMHLELGLLRRRLESLVEQRTHELLISDERLRLATQAAKIGVWDWDVVKDELIWDESMFRLYGILREDFGGAYQAWLSCVHPDDAQTAQEGIHAALRGEKEYDLEFRIVRSDGSTRFIHAASQTFRDPDGKPLRMIGTNVDITERKMAQEALALGEERFRKLFEESPIGIALLGEHNEIVLFNPRYRDLVGYSEAEITELGLKGLLHPDDWGPSLEQIDKLRSGLGALPHMEQRYIRKDGTTAWADTQIVALRNAAGKFLHTLVWFQDITERKRLEADRSHMEAQYRQVQKMEALGTLAGGIAHDFNNILGVITGYSELALVHEDNLGRQRDCLNQVITAANRAKDLVKQILAFSRMAEHEKRPVEIGLIVKEVSKMLRASLPATIEIRLDLASHATVLADPTQIHQVLLNLCANAAQAMPDSGGVLEVHLADLHIEPGMVTAHPQLKSGPHVRLTVADTGHGIDPSIMERVFDPFFTTKQPGVGTGLGLSVVHGIVISIGGCIDVESSVGKGTAFHVFLPTMDPAPAAVETASGSPLPGGDEKILVVDDEIALAEAIKEMLEHLGYEVECRSNGMEAIEAFRNQVRPFDLVITDLTMPHMTGIDLARELFRLQPGLPIILCSGFSKTTHGGEAMDPEIQGVLMKPVLLKDLAGLVRTVIDATNRQTSA